MVGPLLAAGVIVGVLVPRTSARAADAALSRAVASTSTVLAERCLGLGDLSRTAATQLAAQGPAARTDGATAAAVIGPLVAGRPGTSLLVLTLDRPVAGAGPLGTGWDPATATGASCSRRAAGTSSVPLLVETADLPVADGAPPARVVAV